MKWTTQGMCLLSYFFTFAAFASFYLYWDATDIRNAAMASSILIQDGVLGMMQMHIEVAAIFLIAAILSATLCWIKRPK